MRPKKLTVHNFKSFGKKQVVDFTQYGEDEVIMIMGKNLDDPGMDSNGAGKTSFFDAICWVLLGVIPDQDDVSEVIKHGEKECQVELELDGDDEVRIIRSRREKKRSTKEDIQVWLNGKEVTERTNSQTQDYLLDLFGLSESKKTYLQDFNNTTYFPVDLADGLTSNKLTSKDKFDLIARYLKLQRIDRVKDRLKELNNKAREDIDSMNAKVEAAKESLAEVTLEDLKEQVKDRRGKVNQEQEALKTLNKKVNNLKSENNLYEKRDNLEYEKAQSIKQAKGYQAQVDNSSRKLEEVKEKISKIESKLAEVGDPSKMEAPTDQEIVDAQMHLEKGNKARYELLNKKSLIGAQIDDSLVCPSCEADLMLTDDGIHIFLEVLDLRPLEKEYTQVVKKIEKIGKGIDKMNDIIDEKKEKRKEVKELENKVKLLENQKTEVEKSLESIEENIQTFKDLKEKAEEKFLELEDQLEDIESKLKKDDNSALKDKIRKLEDQIDVKTELKDNILIEIGNLESKIENYQKAEETLKEIEGKLKKAVEENAPVEFWLSNIDEMKRWIIESFLPELEELTNKYLADIETGFTIKFNTVKEKRSQIGELKEEFNITIVDSSQQERGISSFSKGESYRIAICTGFALRQLTLNQGSNNFDFILVDEIVDGIDQTGVIEFTRLLDNIQGLKFIISHNPEVGDSFSNQIYSIKKDGNSTIKQY